MKFVCLFAVKDIHASRTFYEELFELKVIEDYGRNIAFDCGLGLQQDFDWLVGISKDEMVNRENNCEIYFERKDFDEFIKKLKQRKDITLLHDVLEQPWGQRGIRFYDLDNHLIEVGESLKSVIERFQVLGMNIADIVKKMDVKKEDVERILQE